MKFNILVEYIYLPPPLLTMFYYGVHFVHAYGHISHCNSVSSRRFFFPLFVLCFGVFLVLLSFSMVLVTLLFVCVPIVH